MKSNNTKGKMEPLYILTAIVAVAFIGCVTMIAIKDNGSTAAMNRANAIEGMLSEYVSKLDYEKKMFDTREMISQVDSGFKDWSATVASKFQLIDKRQKELADELDILKSRMSATQLQKAKQERTVIHKHEYSQPMSIDLNYPPKVLNNGKGKGRGSPLERSRQ